MTRRKYKVLAIDSLVDTSLKFAYNCEKIYVDEIESMIYKHQNCEILCTVILPQEQASIFVKKYNEFNHKYLNVHFAIIMLVTDNIQLSQLDNPFASFNHLFYKMIHFPCDNTTLEHTIRNSFNFLSLQKVNTSLKSKLDLNTEDLRRIAYLGQSLATEHDFDKLIELILQVARELVSADGGSIYLVEYDDEGKANSLRFKKSVLMLDADEFTLPINHSSIAGYVALTNEPLIIDDVHSLPDDAEYSFNSDFDKGHDYYTKSMMVIPMINHENEVIGILQMINRKRDFKKDLNIEEMKGVEVIAFSRKDFELLSAIGGQAAVAIENQRLITGQKKLLESFIQLIAEAIDSKSDYTGAHCRRVPILTLMLAEATCCSKEDTFKDFHLSSDDWYELRIAAWLHDCGKITTPVHVMDKSTKLETISDRIETVKTRLEVLRKEAKINFLENSITILSRQMDNTSIKENLQEEYELKLKDIDLMEQIICNANMGGEFLEQSKIEQLKKFAKIQYSLNGKNYPLLTEEELANLTIQKGTLTDEERVIINSHMVETVKMLEKLPFPKQLKRVPEYATGHHEKIDGTGYPRGIYANDMSLPARMMVIADVFEALTAGDRPYKPAMKLSRAIEIMGHMKADNHLDPNLFDLFITSKTYLKYAKQFLNDDLIDEIDEEKYLNIKPKEFTLPPVSERNKRWQGFLPEYEKYAIEKEQVDVISSIN